MKESWRLFAKQGGEWMGGGGGPSPDVGPQMGAPLPPVAPRRSGGMGGIIAGALGLVAAGGGVAAYMLLRGRSLPLKMNQLPSDTISVSRSVMTPSRVALRYGLQLGDVPDELRWSAFVRELCGGIDIARVLMEDSEYGADPVAKALTDDKDATKAAFLCAKQVASELGSKPAAYNIAFKVKKEEQRVTLIALGMKALPDTRKEVQPVKDPDNLEGTRCVKADDAKVGKNDKNDVCDGTAVAKVKGQSVYAVGSYRMLSTFSDEMSPEGKNKIEDGDLIEKAFKGASGDEVYVSVYDEHYVLMGLPRVKDEDLQKKIKSALKNTKLSVHSVSFDGPWENHHFEFHIDNEADAKDVQDALEKYMREAGRQAKDDADREQEAEEKMPSDDDQPAPKERRAFAKARSKLKLAAIKEAKIDRSGETVTLDMVESPDDDAKKAFGDFAKVNAERAQKVAAVIDKIMAGETLDSKALRDLAPNLADVIDPPEFVDLKQTAGIKMPGGGRCHEQTKSALCTYAKGDKDKLFEKFKTQAEKDGYEVKKDEHGDSTYEVTKGDKKLTLLVSGSGASGASMTLIVD